MQRSMTPRATAVAAVSLASALATASVPTAAQAAEPAMHEFTGRLGCGRAVATDDATDPSRGVSFSSAFAFPVVDMSDERFAGSHVSRLVGYEAGDPDVDGIGSYAGRWQVVDDGGGWVGEYSTFRFAPGSYSTITVELDGQGANAGLTAIMEADFTEDCGWDIRGVVLDGDLPATPEGAATTE